MCTTRSTTTCVSLNIGAYEHFADKLDDLDVDFYACPKILRKQKALVRPGQEMLIAYRHWLATTPSKSMATN